MWLARTSVVVCALAACGFPTPPKLGGPSDAARDGAGDASHDAFVDPDADIDATGSIDASPDAAFIADAPGPSLTLKNYLSWCSVSVDGGAASTTGVQTVPVTVGNTVALVAEPASTSFTLGANTWHHTDGDTGGGEPGTVIESPLSSTAHLTITGSQCVAVCCPFTNGTGCPTTDQCP